MPDDPVVGMNPTPDREPVSSDNASENMDSVRKIIRERPVLNRRAATPRDSVLPRGVHGLTRIPPGSVIPRSSAHFHENSASSDTPEEKKSTSSESSPPLHRTDRQIQTGNISRGSRRPYGYRKPAGTWHTPSERPPRGDYGNRQHKEPLSLAEELAEEMSRGHRRLNENSFAGENMDTIGKLQSMSAAELIAEARKWDIPHLDEQNLQQQDLIFRILKEKIKLNGLMYGEGTLEILPDGFGFLRSIDYHYISCPDDIYVSPSQIRRFGLKTGTIISGQIRPPKENERYFALLRVEAINYRDPNEFSRKQNFEELTPTHPTRRLKLEADSEDVETRVLDMMVPIGFGQRGLIVSPPRAGKTILLQKIAKAALKNYPSLYVFILLVDERPEEVTDMRRQVQGLNCEVISSTFDEPSIRHIQVTEMVLEKAKRMVEYGQDVMILLDSITRLARAWNSETEPSGKTLSGGVDSHAIQFPKRFFSAARCIEQGGSLTILATALTETGSTMDQVILEEFQGTGNLEIVLDKKLVEQRIWPSMDLNQSGTRREEMLRSEEEFLQITKLRRVLYELNPVDAMEMLTNRLRRTQTNTEFLAGIS